MALHYLIFDGVLERHPKLKLFAMHGGGYLGAYSGRIDHAWGARSDCHADLPKPPTTYLKQVYVDTVVFTPASARGAGQDLRRRPRMMGTDYPFDMLEHDPIGHIASVESFDDATRAALAGGNGEETAGAVALPSPWGDVHAYRKSSTAVSAITASSVLCLPARACSSALRVACR